MKKNYLFIEKTNANEFKRKFAFRKLFLSLTLILGVTAMFALSAISTGNYKGVGSFAAATALIVMPTGLMKDKETATHNADGTEKTNEEKLLFIFKWESEQGIAKAIKEADDANKIVIKGLQDQIKELKPDNSIYKQISDLRTDLDEAGVKINRIKEAPMNGVPTIKDLTEQIKEWSEANKEVIAKIASGTKAELPAMVIKVNSPMTPANTYNSSAYLPQPEFDPNINEIVRVQPTFWDYITKGRTGSAAYVWVNKKNPLGAAGFIGPGVAKPGISFELATETSNAKKIAVSDKVATELLQDIPGMASYIQQELAYQLKAKMNTTLMTGASSSTVPAGIQTLSTTFTLTTIATANPGNWDAIVALVAQLRSGNLMGPVTVFMNPVDYANMKLHKAASQGQLFIPSESGATIVEDNNIAVGYIQAAILPYYRILIYQDFTVAFGWENDDFTKNLVTTIAEMRVHQMFSENYTGAFIYDTLANIKTAITAV